MPPAHGTVSARTCKRWDPLQAHTTIRMAEPADLPAILGIYNEVIATSTAVYALEPVTLENRTAWFEGLRKLQYPVLVATIDGTVAGFSAFGDWRGGWAGYRHTVEHSVHVDAAHRGHGLGRQLVEALFPYARALEKHVMLGGIDASNSSSIRFHERLGFERVAHFQEVGHKFGRWLDLVFMQKKV